MPHKWHDLVKRIDKLFWSSNINVIDECRLFFNFMLPSEKIEKRRIGFESKVGEFQLDYFTLERFDSFLSDTEEGPDGSVSLLCLSRGSMLK